MLLDTSKFCVIKLTDFIICFAEKLGRLWEFIRDLLLNPLYNPSLICWENYEEGTFRFVHSDRVAKLWGSKKDNIDMNYEKLSRAMRSASNADLNLKITKTTKAFISNTNEE